MASLSTRETYGGRASVRWSMMHGVTLKDLSERSSGPSIREAIVGARAREEHLRSRRRDVEENDANGAAAALVARRRIAEEAELRARERMEAELAATRERMRRDEEERRRARLKEEEEREARRTREEAFERWKMDVERERRREEGEGALPDRSRSHPVLGPEVASLPYKRIHLTPASTLASLPVYEDQRAYRHDRAKVMARDKKKTLWMGIPGIISLVEDEEGRLSIVDGQHRVGMMSLLEEEQRRIREEGSGIIGIAGANGAAKDELVDLDLDNVLVEVFFHRQVDGDADGRSVNGSKRLDPGDVRAAIFTEINKAEPVKLLDLPGVATKRTRAIIDHATSRLHDSYPVMFSPSQRCRAPHLNVDNLRDQLFAAEVIVRISAGSGGELLRWMEERNGELRERYGGDGGGDESLTKVGDGKRVSEAALKKARKHDFYLGLESTWLYK